MNADLVHVDPNAPGLLSVERARAWLAQAVAVDEVKDFRDKAEAIAAYQRKQGAGLASQQDAAEVILDATRKLGQLLIQMPKDHGGGNVSRGPRAGTKREPAVAPVASYGITKKAAAVAQQVAAMPARQYEEAKAEARKRSARPTASAVLASKRTAEKAEKTAELRSKPVPKPSGRFDVIAVDPPWRYGKRAEDSTHRGRNPYPDMAIDEIMALPVEKHAEASCILWLWTTNAFVHESFHCLARWGFEPKTILTWAKNKMGTGDWLRGQTEHCILAVRGKPTVQLTNETTLLRADAREHSRKPEEFYSLVERLCPGTKLEMFAREKRRGWQAWGAETEKF